MESAGVVGGGSADEELSSSFSAIVKKLPRKQGC
jgi:hypothetical protein